MIMLELIDEFFLKGRQEQEVRFRGEPFISLLATSTLASMLQVWISWMLSAILYFLGRLLACRVATVAPNDK